jgi:hypothetical protein
MAASGVFLAGSGLASAYKRDRSAFWFLALIYTSQPRLRNQLQNREERKRRLAGIHSIAIGPGSCTLIQTRCFKTFADLDTVGGCDSDCPDIDYSIAANWPFKNAAIIYSGYYVENLFSTIAPNGLMLPRLGKCVSHVIAQVEQRRPIVKGVDIICCPPRVFQLSEARAPRYDGTVARKD